MTLGPSLPPRWLVRALGARTLSTPLKVSRPTPSAQRGSTKCGSGARKAWKSGVLGSTVWPSVSSCPAVRRLPVSVDDVETVAAADDIRVAARVDRLARGSSLADIEPKRPGDRAVDPRVLPGDRHRVAGAPGARLFGAVGRNRSGEDHQRTDRRPIGPCGRKGEGRRVRRCRATRSGSCEHGSRGERRVPTGGLGRDDGFRPQDAVRPASRLSKGPPAAARCRRGYSHARTTPAPRWSGAIGLMTPDVPGGGHVGAAP